MSVHHVGTVITKVEPRLLGSSLEKSSIGLMDNWKMNLWNLVVGRFTLEIKLDLKSNTIQQYIYHNQD